MCSVPRGSGHVDSWPPKRVGKYVLQSELGRGGMGAVFSALDPLLNRLVAVKLMLPSLAKDPECRQRFLREARAAASVACDSVVTIYEVDQDHGLPYLVMELLQGESLADYLKRERILPPVEVVSIALQIATVLRNTELLSLIHRDIKPANLWLEAPEGRVKLLDFGLVLQVVTMGQASLSISGTPGYMSADIFCRGESPLTPRSDIFSLGAVMYEMATGKRAFPGDDIWRTATDEPLHPNKIVEGLPPALTTLVMEMLDKSPEKRPSAQQVEERLLAMLETPGFARHTSITWQPAFIAVGLTVVVLLILSILNSAMSGRQRDKANNPVQIVRDKAPQTIGDFTPRAIPPERFKQ